MEYSGGIVEFKNAKESHFFLTIIIAVVSKNNNV
jgi:hypothetical protein